MSSGFKDFIPAGEDTGGLGAGLTDFVPTPEPKKEVKKPDAAKPEQKPEQPQDASQPSRFRFPGQKQEGNK